MELKQHLIHRNYCKTEAKNQIIIGDDYSIADGKPDISAVLQKKAELLVSEVHTEKGKVRLRGVLKTAILYAADHAEEALAGLTAEIPFDEILYVDGAVSGDNLKIDWEIEELRINIIHPGKISIRAAVNLSGVIMGTEMHMITEGIGEEPYIYTKTDQFLLAEPVTERNDGYRIRDEILLPVNKPNVRQVLWQDLQIRGLDLRILENGVGVKGEVLFFAVYEGEEENGEIQWIEQSVPFHGTLEVPGITSEMYGMFETGISHQEVVVKPDYDGEMRSFQLELLLDVHMSIYEEQSCGLLLDAYSTEKKLEIKQQSAAYQKLRMCNEAKCRISGQEKLEDGERILQILGHHAQMSGKRGMVTEEGIRWEGILHVQVLYVTASDSQPFGCIGIRIPYSQVIEIPDMDSGDKWKVTERLEQVFLSVPDGSRIELRAVIGLNACVLEKRAIPNITEIEEKAYDPEVYENCPGMKIHFVQPKETLWEIAKENRIAAAELKKFNELNTEEIVPGQKLLIVKPPVGTVLS